jgi:hypothetical protein
MVFVADSKVAVEGTFLVVMVVALDIVYKVAVMAADSMDTQVVAA